MWRLKSIDITNLLNRYDLHWDLDPVVNILGGANGTGKSTVLKAIFMQYSQEDDSRKIAPFSDGVFSLLESKMTDGRVFRVGKSVKHIQTELPPANGTVRSSEEEEVTITISVKKPEDLTNAYTQGINVVYINSMDTSVEYLRPTFDNSTLRFRAATSVLDLLLETELNRRNAIFADRMQKAITGGNPEERDRLTEVFGRFEAVLKRFMPDYDVENVASLTFRLPGLSDEKIPFFRLSGGEKQLLFLLLKISNTLGNPTVVLLDEADMGMHVDWKRILLSSLLDLNPNLQIIASTHSPALIEGWRDKVKEIGQITAPAAMMSNRTVTE